MSNNDNKKIMVNHNMPKWDKQPIKPPDSKTIEIF